MAKRKSSKRWLREHFDDPYVRKAQAAGYRSRAWFKLEEIQAKYRLLKPGMTIVDLGAAPGSWSQYASQLLGKKDTLIALDILPMEPLPGVIFIQGDFREDAVLDQLLQTVTEAKVDLVMSDMAPNISGVEAIDQPRSMYLVELAVDFARQVLAPGGCFVAKVFQGEGFEALLKQLRTSFGTVNAFKPKASRGRSREVYLLARNYKI